MERGVIGLLCFFGFEVDQITFGLIDCFYQVAFFGSELGDFVLDGMATVGVRFGLFQKLRMFFGVVLWLRLQLFMEGLNLVYKFVVLSADLIPALDCF